LLGKPCATCMAAVQAALTASVHPPLRRTRAPAVRHGPADACQTCEVGRIALRTVQASAAPPDPTLAEVIDRARSEHRPRPAPTGHVSTVDALVHSGQGEFAECGARILKYEARRSR
jgi:hypothetical protein